MPSISTIMLDDDQRIIALTDSDLEAVITQLESYSDYTLFSSPEWYQTLSKWVLEGEYKVVYFARIEDEIPLILPMMSMDDGKRINSVGNYYSPIFEPMANVGATASKLMGFLRMIKQRYPRMNRICFEALECESSFYGELTDALNQSGFQVFEGVHSVNWYQPCEGISFDDYWASRNSRMRNTFKRKQQQLQCAGDIKIDVIRADNGDLQHWVTQYQLVYAKSWKTSEAYPHFIPELIKLAAAKGWLRLGILSLNNKPIAAQLWLVSNKIASIYKLAYDADYSRYSPGTILTAAMFETIMSHDDIHEIDFLTGDDAYKSDWMDQKRNRMWLVGCNKGTLMGYLYAIKYWCRK